ncbi:PIG-L deacetylase family protein [Umezawaea sp. Da 62-37]|uniref:PIG-L deacetylase family protein n=1 Tax=Umezawaea sp. Da 62-37 TaxID=3075927 RepID=UPI0028F6C84C|nr:PIG-L deacetylase family protein [Umezawaea sp. Da 62-37]WNV89806.1 PIG-L deacetylase family protein [Umezawaea sp. Da 62-37]
MDDLTPVPEDWRSALAVVAHPDDLEYGASGAIARWTDQGKTVRYLLACRGEAGIDTMPPEEAGPVREREQIASAAVVGVSEVEFLDHPDGMMTYGLPLRRDIAAAIRRHKPELLIIGNHHETYAGGFLNMADHRVVGAAAVDAVRDAANRWVFRELGLEPWGGVKHVAVSESPRATHAVDITDHLDLSIASLREHASYLAVLTGDMADPERFLRRSAEKAGERFGGRPATTFELLDM